MNSIEVYNNKIARRNKIRWVSLLLYFLFLTGYIFYQITVEFETTGMAEYLLVIFGGFIFIMLVIIYPYFYPIEQPVRSEDDGITQRVETPPSYYEEVKLTILVYLTIPFFLIFSVISIWMISTGDYTGGLIFSISGMFFLVIYVVFDKLLILSDETKLTIKFGPFSETILFVEISKIRETSIKPLRTYLGYGKRISTDGSIGYITGTTTGVRIEITGKRDIVLSTNQSKQLISFIRGVISKNPS